MALIKSVKTYSTTYDRDLTSMLNNFLAYVCSTTDSDEEQKELADIMVAALRNSLDKSLK
jgi:hypothetical protein